MAEIKDIEVSVEKTAHDALRKVAEVLWAQHGLCVKNVYFSWHDASGVSEHKMILGEVAIETMTKNPD